MNNDRTNDTIIKWDNTNDIRDLYRVNMYEQIIDTNYITKMTKGETSKKVVFKTDQIKNMHNISKTFYSSYSYTKIHNYVGIEILIKHQQAHKVPGYSEMWIADIKGLLHDFLCDMG